MIDVKEWKVVDFDYHLKAKLKDWCDSYYSLSLTYLLIQFFLGIYSFQFYLFYFSNMDLSTVKKSYLS